MTTQDRKSHLLMHEVYYRNERDMEIRNSIPRAERERIDEEILQIKSLLSIAKKKVQELNYAGKEWTVNSIHSQVSKIASVISYLDELEVKLNMDENPINLKDYPLK